MNDNTECYELSLSENYVNDWTFENAIRELVQNGIDQESIDKSNKFTFDYNKTKNQITLRNKKSKLKIETLLLGCSTKSKNEDTVGQFGEGYKIAALVLTRLGKNFTIYNNERNEKWTCRFKNSIKWHSKILAFYIEKYKTDETGLDIVIDNVSEEEYINASEMWLGEYYYYSQYNSIDTSYGEILTEEDLLGKIYVNGLFVYYDEELKYGYNFKPKYIKLERDRKTCNSWDIGEITTKMVLEATVNGKISIENMGEMLENDSYDMRHIQYNSYMTSASKVAEKLMKQFEDTHTNLSIPVYTKEQENRVKALGGNPVFISRQMSQLLSYSIEEKIKELAKITYTESLTVKEKFNIWINSYKNNLPSNAVEEFLCIMKKLD